MYMKAIRKEVNNMAKKKPVPVPGKGGKKPCC